MAFRLHTSHNALIFQATSIALTQSDIEGFSKEINGFEEDHSLVVLDLSKAENIDDQTLEKLANIGKSFLTKKIKVMVLAKEQITALIKAKNFTDVLPCYVGIVPIFKEGIAASSNQKVDHQLLLESALNALKDNIKIYAKMDLQVGEVFIGTQHELPPMDIAGVGGFFCNEVRGSLVLVFNKESYLKLASAIQRQPYLKFEPSMSDWAGEFVNAMLGRMKTEMKLQGLNCTVGIPTVFIGKDLEMFSSAKLTRSMSIVKCSSEFGELYLALALNSTGESKK